MRIVLGMLTFLLVVQDLPAGDAKNLSISLLLYYAQLFDKVFPVLRVNLYVGRILRELVVRNAIFSHLLGFLFNESLRLFIFVTND